MTVLVLGGAASGKSAFAERLACARAERTGAPLVYVATLDPGSGGDTRARIRRHRAARAGKGFATLEWLDARTIPAVPENAVVLVEDGGNLTANFLYPPGQPPAPCDPPAAAATLAASLHALAARCADCIVVSNEITLGGDIPAASRPYAATLAALNRRQAAASDAVYAVVAGIPLALKGAAGGAPSVPCLDIPPPLH